MKILVTFPYFFPDRGGAENRIFRIAKRLVEDYGVEVIVIASNTKNPSRQEIDYVHGMKVYRLPYRFKLSNTPMNLLWYFQIKKILDKEKPDVIDAHTPVPFMSDITALAARDIPFTLTIHAGGLYKSKAPLFNAVAAVYNVLLGNRTLKKAVMIGAASDYVRTQLPASIQPRTHVLHNAIDQTAGNISVKKHPDQLIFIGSLDKSHSWKGLEYILKAVQLLVNRVPGIRLVVLGDGTRRAWYEAYAKDLGIQTNVQFEGFVDGAQKFKFLKASEAAIVYPFTNNDAFPTIFLEAWATGIPVIAADIGALPTFIKDHETGILVEPRNPEALAESTFRLLQDKKLKGKLGHNGEQLIQASYNWPQSTKETFEFFETAIKEHKRSKA